MPKFERKADIPMGPLIPLGDIRFLPDRYIGEI